MKGMLHAIVICGIMESVSLAQEDDSLEGLYLGAQEKIQVGDYEGALPLYKEAIKFLRLPGETFGAGIGEVYFDYGTCLLQLFRWEEARDAFKICVKDYPNQESKSKLDTGNKRWNLALFQWGYCEQQMGNPEKAQKLYKQYKDSKPDKKEWEAVRNVYHLRLGGTLIAAGKKAQGETEIKRLLQNSDKWKIQPELLKQALNILDDGNKRESEPVGKVPTAKSIKEFETGKDKTTSGEKDSLNAKARQYWRDYKGKELSPWETLNLGRDLISQERWADAKEQFGRINKNKRWLNRAERAESNFKYGLCLEKLGKTDDAIRVYNAVIAVYGSYIEWSSQALERGFELAYKTDVLEKRVKAYSYLRKILWMFDGHIDEEASSGALTRLRSRLPVIKNALGMPPEQLQEIDRRLGIAWIQFSVEGEDATSKHYYFYHTDIGVGDRIRWVWNGGAQNLPTVTDFVLDSGKITIRHLTGSRNSISELILGGVTELELKEEYSIDSQYSVEEMRLIDTKKTLTEKQRSDLANLADLLTKDRKDI